MGMQLCFDATRFGCGLAAAVELAAAKALTAVEFTFQPFPVAGRSARTLARQEERYLGQIAALCRDMQVEIVVLNLDFCLQPLEKRSAAYFEAMVARLARVCSLTGCQRLSFALEPAAGPGWSEAAEQVLNQALGSCAQAEVKPLLRLGTAHAHHGQSLRDWRPLNPDDWRAVLAGCPGLSLSFSPADCVWQGIDYLKILPAMVPAIEHIAANDVEINRELIADAGLFGPLWWRYRLVGKGQVDWRQLVEALKLYDYAGSFSIHLDDEFVNGDLSELGQALDASISFLAPLLRG